MNRLKDKFFSYLTKKEGFYVEFYKSEYRNEDVAVAMKRFPQGIYAIIITEDRYENIDYIEGMNYLNLKGESYALHTIVLTNGEYNNGISNISKKVVVDCRAMKTLYCDEGCEPIVAIVQKVWNSENELIEEFKNYFLTYSIILINVVMFIICAIKSRNIMDINPYVLIEYGAKFRLFIDYGNEWWRLITCNFLHGGLIHLAFNMYALYILGRQIEVIYGRAKYSIIYALSGLGASLLSYYLSPESISVGASGAIFGLLGALLVFAYKERGKIQKGVISNLIFVIGINLVFGLSMSGIDNFGHIGGLLIGLIASYVLYTLSNSRKKVV